MKRILMLSYLVFVCLIFVACFNQTPTAIQQSDIMKNTVQATNVTQASTEGIDDAAGDPPVEIRLSLKEVLQLLRAQSDSNEKLENCIDELGLSYYREDTTVALKLFQTLAIPSIKGAEEKINLTYYPHLPAIYVSCAVDQNAWYRFEYVLNTETAKQTKETIDTENMNLDASITTDQDITVLSKVTITDAELAKRYAEFWIDIDGYLVKMIYRNTEKDLSANRYDEMFSDLQVSLINELA